MMKVAMKTRLLCCAVCLLTLSIIAPVGAEIHTMIFEAPDITARCRVTVARDSRQALPLLAEDQPPFEEAPVDMLGVTRPYVQVNTPAGEPAYGLYIVWAYEPDDWQLMTPNPDWEWHAHLGDQDAQSAPRWIEEASGGVHGFLHEYMPLDGLTSLRIQPRRVREHPFSIEALYVLGEGATPGWVQTWAPLPDRVDLMVIAAHPDDDLLQFGGTLPTYAGERGLETAVVYMTYGLPFRRSELLNGLWAAGVRSYPVMGDFMDVYTVSAQQAAALCGDEQAGAFLVEQLRRYKPKVVVSHDLNGEYGHGMHRFTAQKTLEAVEELAWNAECFPESAEAYGVWDIDKLYMHLWPENKIVMDWRVPLEAFGGRTALEVALDAYDQHVSQRGLFSMALEGNRYSCFEFGLALTNVGPDVRDGDFGDFFENVTPWREEEGNL